MRAFFLGGLLFFGYLEVQLGAGGWALRIVTGIDKPQSYALDTSIYKSGKFSHKLSDQFRLAADFITDQPLNTGDAPLSLSRYGSDERADGPQFERVCVADYSTWTGATTFGLYFSAPHRERFRALLNDGKPHRWMVADDFAQFAAFTTDAKSAARYEPAVGQAQGKPDILVRAEKLFTARLLEAIEPYLTGEKISPCSDDVSENSADYTNWLLENWADADARDAARRQAATINVSAQDK